MSLSNPQMRAIELMIEQMERLEPQLRRNRQLDSPRPADQIVREFYDENTRVGKFELNYLQAIAKCLAPNPEPQDLIVVTKI